MTYKKILKFAILAFAVTLLVSNAAYAKPFTEAFKGGLASINSFFESGQYKVYSKVIDFFIFSLLFISLYNIGAMHVFKDIKRPERIIVIILGLITAFLLVIGGYSIILLLPFVNWFLYVLIFLFWWWLLK